jgi:hypothetical protein
MGWTIAMDGDIAASLRSMQSFPEVARMIGLMARI